jgi:8-oxo-dGTP pyrophosphatase MutT (NUDIX family)
MRSRWKPAVTVAAVIERDGRFLLVEERTPEGLKLNQPAGHLERGEGLLEACVREVLEETAHAFTPQYLLGVYLARTEAARGAETYLRFAFGGELGARLPQRLDRGIVRTLWLTADELRTRSAQHRSVLVMLCGEDYLAGRRFPLVLLAVDASALGAPRPHPSPPPQAGEGVKRSALLPALEPKSVSPPPLAGEG